MRYRSLSTSKLQPFISAIQQGRSSKQIPNAYPVFALFYYTHHTRQPSTAHAASHPDPTRPDRPPASSSPKYHLPFPAQNKPHIRVGAMKKEIETPHPGFNPTSLQTARVEYEVSGNPKPTKICTCFLVYPYCRLID